MRDRLQAKQTPRPPSVQETRRLGGSCRAMMVCCLWCCTIIYIRLPYPPRRTYPFLHRERSPQDLCQEAPFEPILI